MKTINLSSLDGDDIVQCMNCGYIDTKKEFEGWSNNEIACI